MIAAGFFLLLGLGAFFLMSESARNGLGGWMPGEKPTPTTTERIATLRARQGKPLAPPRTHAEALLQCAEAQDLAVAVSVDGRAEDATLANDEMRRVCRVYFDLASRRNPGPVQ
ncbi:hypothetical protein BH09PSE1_BH09PSE1_05270 [soil metagenome]